MGDTGPDATDKLISQFYAHVGQPVPKTAKKRSTEAELKVPEKTCKTPGVMYLGYGAIYSDFYDLSKCG